MTQFSRSLTPIIFYDKIGLSHLSYYNKTKIKNKKGLETSEKNDMLRQVSLIGRENDTNNRLQRTNNQRHSRLLTSIKYQTPIQKRQNNTSTTQPEQNYTKDLIGL